MAYSPPYIFEPDPFCLFCRNLTKDKMAFETNVFELAAKEVAIPVHRGCYRRSMAWMWFKILLCLILIFLAFSESESLLFCRSYRFDLGLPGWAFLVNGFVSVLASAVMGLRWFWKFQDDIDHYIRLHTVPIN